MLHNAYPIVLVHGFAGWGREELLGVKYWGGVQGDFQELLKKQGYTVFTATVGPFSSNWDRACELYAQIKGGRVDYGEVHSKAHGHARYGRTFPGLYPQWGEADADGRAFKVHLVGHSMGGQTIRMLAQLLAKGSKGAPVEEPATTHPLFAGGKDWVHSITTIATPNQGALVANGLSEVAELVKVAVFTVFSSLGVFGDSSDDLYDAKLDQWGISPRARGESLAAYLERVFSSSIFKPGFRDISLWSLSTDGAKEDSKWIQTLEDVYYFSYATSDTHASRDFMLRRVQTPNLLTMFFALQPLGAVLGGRFAQDHGFSEEWQENDGVVNTVSMATDGVGARVEFTGVAELGVWNSMPKLEPMDHIAVVGLTIHTNVLKKVYAAHAKLLGALPIDLDPASDAHKKAHDEQRLACDQLTQALMGLRAEVAAEAAAEAAMRRTTAMRSDQEQYADDSLITMTAWGADETVKPIAVMEQEP